MAKSYLPTIAKIFFRKEDTCPSPCPAAHVIGQPSRVCNAVYLGPSGARWVIAEQPAVETAMGRGVDFASDMPDTQLMKRFVEICMVVKERLGYLGMLVLQIGINANGGGTLLPTLKSREQALGAILKYSTTLFVTYSMYFGWESR